MSIKKNVSFSWTELSSQDELPAADLELLIGARAAAQNAYAPYSRFKVGAAVRLESGIIVAGTNVENAAFPSGICAERAALSAASSNYPGDHPLVIAIAALNDEGETDQPVTPCGNCRQVIAEEEHRSGKNIKLILSGRSKITIIEKASDLLPLQFNAVSLRPARR
jgi:cytidine deaminase